MDSTSIILLDGSLTTILRANGDLETYGVAGSLVSVHHLDSSTHEHRPGDVVVHLAADGQGLGVALGGINGMLWTNGSWMVLAPDGTDHVLTAVGNRWIDYLPDGAVTPLPRWRAGTAGRTGRRPGCGECFGSGPGIHRERELGARRRNGWARPSRLMEPR